MGTATTSAGATGRGRLVGRARRCPCSPTPLISASPAVIPPPFQGWTTGSLGGSAPLSSPSSEPPTAPTNPTPPTERGPEPTLDLNGEQFRDPAEGMWLSVLSAGTGGSGPPSREGLCEPRPLERSHPPPEAQAELP